MERAGIGRGEEVWESGHMEEALEKLTDEALMERVAREDEEAFAVLIERHKDRVYGTVSRMLGGTGPDVQDIAQVIFLRVWRAAPGYRSKSKFTTWLMTILRNLVYTHTTQAKRKVFASTDDMEDEDGEKFAYQQADETRKEPDEVMARSELEAAVLRACDHLSPAQRMVVHLRQYEDMGFSEIAKVMKTTPGSVKSLMFRARAILKEKLEKNFGVSF